MKNSRYVKITTTTFDSQTATGGPYFVNYFDKIYNKFGVQVTKLASIDAVKEYMKDAVAAKGQTTKP